MGPGRVPFKKQMSEIVRILLLLLVGFGLAKGFQALRAYLKAKKGQNQD